MRATARILGAIGLAVAAIAPTSAAAQFYQCVAYAREATGITIRGNANTWWGQAEGRYAKGQAPRPGAIMAFRSMPGMPMGHVAVVAKVVGERELLIDHANWSRHGRVERGVRAVDVSAAGDWSVVRVWYGRIGDMGLRTNQVAGFIYPTERPVDAPLQVASVKADRGPLVTTDVVEMAALGG